MSIIYAKKVLEKELELIEMSSLLIDLRSALAKRFPTESQETLSWALDQAILRLSTSVTHSFEPYSMPVDQSTSLRS